MSSVLHSRRSLLAAALLLQACGGGGGDPAPPPAPAPPPPAPLVHEVSGLAVVKASSQDAAVLVLEERLCSIFEQAPVRRLARKAAGLQRWEAPAGWHLLDFAAHPSGEISLVLSTATRLRLLRLSPALQILADWPLDDPQLALDPVLDEGGVLRADSQQPYLMRDAARVATLGEELVLAIRAGLHQVVVYRFARLATQPRWRTLVEPGSSAGGRFLAGGSHDVYGQLENHFRLCLDVAPDGQIAVAMAQSFANLLFAAHRWHFNEPVAADNGLLLTRLSANGQRLGTTVVATAGRTELHGLRTTPQGWALVGRVRSRATADGWDGYVALVDRQGGDGQARVIDVPEAGALFDIAALPDGRFLVAGSCAYQQNPAGASISETAEPLLMRLDATAASGQRLSHPAGPRHNALRCLVRHGESWLVGGLRDGPGTHSGDADLQLVRADGFLLERRDL